MVEEDARFSLREIASRRSISKGSVHVILKDHYSYRKNCARWVPHLLTEDQILQRLNCAREHLKTDENCGSRVISNLLTADKTSLCCYKKNKF